MLWIRMRCQVHPDCTLFQLDSKQGLGNWWWWDSTALCCKQQVTLFIHWDAVYMFKNLHCNFSSNGSKRGSISYIELQLALHELQHQDTQRKACSCHQAKQTLGWWCLIRWLIDLCYVIMLDFPCHLFCKPGFQILWNILQSQSFLFLQWCHLS